MKILSYIDAISEWTGKLFSWSILVLTGIVIYDIILRLFGRATTWAWEVSTYLYAALFLMGGAYVLRYKAHIRIDVLYNLLSLRGRAIFDLCYYLVAFFPLVIVFVWFGTPYAYESWVRGETSGWYISGIPLGPVKAIIPLAFLLLGLQGVAEFVRTLLIAIRGERV